MSRRSVWFASMTAQAMIAMVLLFGGMQSAAADQQKGDVAVKIDNFTFEPQTITVHVGATVTWTNRDDIPHAVASIDGVFRSKVRDTDETFSYTFSKAGTYPYYCSIHPKMTGTIVVQ